MKIVFVAPRYHTNQHAWVKALKEAGHEVHFLVAYADPVTENRTVLTPEVVPNTALPKSICWLLDTFANLTGRVARSDFHSLPSRRWLKQRLADISPDVVIVRHSTYPLSIAAFLAANSLKLKTILYNQNPLDASYNWSTRLLQLLGIVPRHRITPLRRSKEATYYAPTNSYYVPLIVDTDFDTNSRTYCPDGVLRFLFIGKFNMPRKQHILMLKAFAQVHAQINATLTIVGFATPESEEYLLKLKDIATRLGISNAVVFKKNLSSKEIFSEYQSGDVFVLPSTNEPFAITPLEAMYCGLPVIVTDTNGTQSCITDGTDGFIVESENLEGLVDAMSSFSNVDIITKMGKLAHLKIKDHYSKDNFIQYFDEAVEN